MIVVRAVLVHDRGLLARPIRERRVAAAEAKGGEGSEIPRL